MEEPVQSFAARMVARLQTILLENAGLSEVDVDGERVRYADIEAQLTRWQRRLDIERGHAATISTIRLDRF